MTVRPLNRFTWEAAAELELAEYQQDFLPPNLFSIAQAHYEGLTAAGIFADGSLVGFATYGNLGGVCWISRIMVAKDQQEKGYGTRALRILLDQLRTRPDCAEIRTSFVRANAIAEYFFSKNGFRRIADGLDDEIVMRYMGDSD